MNSILKEKYLSLYETYINLPIFEKLMSTFCFFSTTYVSFALLKKFKGILLKFKHRIQTKRKINNEYIIIFGFGDSFAGLNIIEYYSGLGFNFILVNNKHVLQYRQEQNLDENEGLHKFKCKWEIYSYLDFIDKFHEINEKKITYIYDISIFRVFTKNTKVIDKNNKFENSVYYYDKITKELNFYQKAIDLIVSKSENDDQIITYFVRFTDKVSDVNHVLISDFKMCFLKHYQELFKKIKLKEIFVSNSYDQNNLDLNFLRKIDYYKDLDFVDAIKN